MSSYAGGELVLVLVLVLDLNLPIISMIPTIKPGIKLPKSYYDWELANDFFSSSLPVSDVVGLDINTVVSSMNSTIYDYFHENLENTDSSHFVGKYKDYSIAMPKSTLKTLKRSKSDVAEIKYVARTIRLRLRNNTTNSNEASIDHDKHIQKSFWRYVKEHIQQGTSISPSFDSSTCIQFFSKFFRSTNPSKSFIIGKCNEPTCR